MSFCIANNLIVYPVDKKGKWFIEVLSNEKIIFSKEVEKSEIQFSICKTWEFYYKKLKSLENGIDKGNSNS